jgi:phage/plasmid-associated DNA primase
VLNWAVEGWRLIQETGFDAPQTVDAAIEAYRSEADIIGSFLSEHTTGQGDGRIPTTELYSLYADWAKANGYKPLNNRSFVMDLRRRYEVKHDSRRGNMIIGLSLLSGVSLSA